MRVLGLVILICLGGAQALRLQLPDRQNFVTDVDNLASALNIKQTSKTDGTNEYAQFQMQNACWDANVKKDMQASEVAPSSIMIATLMYGYPQDIAAVLKGNHERYAKKHGYQYRAIEADSDAELQQYMRGRKGGWGKISLIKELFAMSDAPDYVFWMDADSLFVDDSIELRDLTMLSGDLVIAGDENGLNTGHFLMKNSEWSMELLNSAWDICPPPAFTYEQAGIMAILGGADRKKHDTWHDSAAKCQKPVQNAEQTAQMMRALPSSTQEHITVLPQCTMNTNTHDPMGNDIHPTFIWHLAGGPQRKKDMEHVGQVIKNVQGRVREEMGLVHKAWSQAFGEKSSALPC